MSNIITVTVGNNFVVTASDHLDQWDYGQILRVKGLDQSLSVNKVQCGLENEQSPDTTKDCSWLWNDAENSMDISLVDELLEYGINLIVYITQSAGEDSSTIRRIIIKVDKRDKPDRYDNMATQYAVNKALEEMQALMTETVNESNAMIDNVSEVVRLASQQDVVTVVENAMLAKSYAVGTNDEFRSGDSTDNALYYKNQTALLKDQVQAVANGITGALKPYGTIVFSNLPTSGMIAGDMYNISNDFTSDSRFKDGSGKAYKAGSNVYYTIDGYWDVLASPVQEITYGTSELTDGSSYLTTGVIYFQYE